MQESAQATKIEISKATSKSRSGKSGGPRVTSFVEDNMNTIVCIGMALVGHFMGLERAGVIGVVIFTIGSNILNSLIFLAIKKGLTWVKIFGSVIPIVVAAINVVGMNELFMKLLIHFMNVFSTGVREDIFMEVAIGVLWCCRVFSMIFGRWKPLRAEKIVGVVAMALFTILVSSWMYTDIYDELRCGFKQNLRVGDICAKGVGDQREWEGKACDEMDSPRFKLMMDHFMAPILDPLKGESCIESITVARIRPGTTIVNGAKKNIVISAEDFFPEGTLPAGDINARLILAFYNIIDGVAAIKSRYFPEKYPRMAVTLPIVGLCLFIIGEVLRDILIKSSRSKDKKMNGTALMKYFAIYIVMACAVVFAATFLIHKLGARKTDQISAFIAEKEDQVIAATGKDINRFAEDVIEQLSAGMPGWYDPPATSVS